MDFGCFEYVGCAVPGAYPSLAVFTAGREPHFCIIAEVARLIGYTSTRSGADEVFGGRCRVGDNGFFAPGLVIGTVAVPQLKVGGIVGDISFLLIQAHVIVGISPRDGGGGRAGGVSGRRL